MSSLRVGDGTVAACVQGVLATSIEAMWEAGACEVGRGAAAAAGEFTSIVRGAHMASRRVRREHAFCPFAHGGRGVLACNAGTRPPLCVSLCKTKGVSIEVLVLTVWYYYRADEWLASHI